jgi:ATP phosphoribosyltransferase
MDDVSHLVELTKVATENAVNKEYTEQSDTLISKMNGNIKAREILSMFLEYPEREYPEPEELDPKKKAKKEEPKKKKRKKKEPPFPTPEWANELEAVVS